MYKPTDKIGGYIVQHEGGVRFTHAPIGAEIGGQQHTKSTTGESRQNGEEQVKPSRHGKRDDTHGGCRCST